MNKSQKTHPNRDNLQLSHSPIGAVMVVGGGIAGMQASLDLADQGFKVYLVEKKTAIGGHMAQLDKTFPTNDCAMCNISPKLVDTGRHLNIDILTGTEVLTVEGSAGDFTVTLRHTPRYIDIDKCIGCGDCADVCPVSLPDLYEEGLKDKKAAYRLYTQAVPAAYAIEKLGIAPCRDACPVGQRAQGYIALIAEGRYREAIRVIKEDNPFPSVCGRTCHHPCESMCSRRLADQPVGIMDLKRFVVDYALAYGREKVTPVPRTRAEWIAVVGSGPAGLTAAHDLVKRGYGVTVYEALPVAGGMMRVGIPAHRLPKGVLQQDIDDIIDLGVVLKTNSPIKDPVGLLNQGYDAICLATGISTNDHTLGIEGEDAQGVISAATFLRKINLGEPITIGRRVAVVGGGITALDAAAVARRLGAKEVYLVLDRPRGELPAYHWEVSAVEAEGIHLLERTTATRVITENGNVTGIELAETSKGMIKSADGRRRPKIKSGTEYLISVDTVIGTVGQLSDLNFLDDKYHNISVDKKTFASDIPGLYVVGGRKTGASYIIEAISLGHRVSESIHCYLQKGDYAQTDSSNQQVAKLSRREIAEKVLKGEIKPKKKIEPNLLPIAERVTSFREVVLGLTEHQARAEAQRCLQCGICSECLACEYACESEAIDLDMAQREEKIKVGAVILAPGYQAYNAEHSQEFGFGLYPNVLTALQFERLLSASGPTLGQVQRPSDNTIPQKIAFLQCVGSRDQTHDYCSAVCCMYATKEAIIAKEHHPELDVDVFMMDMRAFSKGYLVYYQRARQQHGVNYIRCRVSMIHEIPGTNDLILDFHNDSGERVTERYNMVVLSVGMEISDSVRDLGKRLSIELDEYGFCSTVNFNPIETTRAGIFAVGPFREPKDIPESVVEASGAAAASASLLSSARWSLSSEKKYPREKEVSEEEPRIGVFVCHCGSNIAGFLDVPEVTKYAGTLTNVVHAEDALYACSQDSIKQISERVKELNLNRVVVASCSPLTHAPLFKDSIRSAGLNPHLIEMANIRNQCSWVHSNDWDLATQKAKELVRMAVARVALSEPQHVIEVPVNKSALVVGGGVAGMTAAISLAEQGFPVHLVEKDSDLGGNLRNVFTSYPRDSHIKKPQNILGELISRVEELDCITVHLDSQISATKGFSGNFKTTINQASGKTCDVEHGATILATGAREYRGPEYGYGKNSKIVTQQEFEAILSSPTSESKTLKSVVMIQCVGPAENFCSRICCTLALKNALTLLEQQPQTQIVILYKDIRSYGFKESLYTEAREKGVLFIRYDDDTKPEVNIINDLNKGGEAPVYYQEDDQNSGNTSSHSQVTIHIRDPILDRRVILLADLLVLSMPIVPNPDVKKISALFKVPIDADGFFLEAHVKLRPVDFSTEGMFMAGMAHYPKLLDETMVQAQAAAARAARILSHEKLSAGGCIAVVDEGLCTACLSCVRVCPFGVPQIQVNLTGVGNIMGAAYIEPSICQGCGLCAGECPAKAIQLMQYTDLQMQAKVHALVDPELSLIYMDTMK